MSGRPFKLRALLYLYGNGNIAGCLLALGGPALLFAGVIDHYWLAITAGLYAVGYLLARRSPELERRIADTLTVEETLEHLDSVIRGASSHLPEEMRTRLAAIRDSVAEVLPRLVGGSGGGDQLFTVRETVLRYLPETLANYVGLPPAFRVNHPLEGGKTARVLLAEQLAVLDDKMREVVAAVASSDAQALLANGQFLQARFRQPDFLAKTS